jgi:hypothetical protein
VDCVDLVTPLEERLREGGKEGWAVLDSPLEEIWRQLIFIKIFQQLRGIRQDDDLVACEETEDGSQNDLEEERGQASETARERERGLEEGQEERGLDIRSRTKC